MLLLKQPNMWLRWFSTRSPRIFWAELLPRLRDPGLYSYMGLCHPNYNNFLFLLLFLFCLNPMRFLLVHPSGLMDACLAILLLISSSITISRIQTRPSQTKLLQRKLVCCIKVFPNLESPANSARVCSYYPGHLKMTD